MNRQTRSYIGMFVILAVIIAILLPPDPAMHMPPLPPHIKNSIWIVLLISGLIFLLFYFQSPEKDPYFSTKAQDIKKGRILEYKTNRIGDIDKMIMSTGDEKVTIHFPPHTASAVMKAAPKGEFAEVRVHPAAKKSPAAPAIFELLSVTSSSSDPELESLPPQVPSTGKKIEISGKAGKYKLDEKGIVAGIIIENYLVDLPPSLVKNILPVMKDSVEIRIMGYERSPGEGFVNLTGLNVVKPYAISIDKTDYLL